MKNGFTVCSWSSESPSQLGRARNTSRRRPAVVEVAFIHGGTLFTNGKDTGAAEFSKKDLAGGLVNVNQYLGVESEVSRALGMTQDLTRRGLTPNLRVPMLNYTKSRSQ